MLSDLALTLCDYFLLNKSFASGAEPFQRRQACVERTTFRVELFGKGSVTQKSELVIVHVRPHRHAEFFSVKSFIPEK